MGLSRQHQLKGFLFIQPSVLQQFLFNLPFPNFRVDPFLLAVETALEGEVVLLSFMQVLVQFIDAFVVVDRYLGELLEIGVQDVGTVDEVVCEDMEEIVDVDE